VLHLVCSDISRQQAAGKASGAGKNQTNKQRRRYTARGICRTQQTHTKPLQKQASKHFIASILISTESDTTQSMYVSTTPGKRWPNVRLRTKPRRSSFRPVQRFGSHCCRSYMGWVSLPPGAPPREMNAAKGKWFGGVPAKTRTHIASGNGVCTALASAPAKSRAEVAPSCLCG
jgi:hypothetical protein